MVWILIQIPFFQNQLAQYAANKLSKELHTQVRVKNVSFTLLNHVNLEGLYIEDQQKDTLLFASQLQLNITDWFLVKDTAIIKYVGLTNAVIYLQRCKDSIWNYQFIANYFAGDKNKKPSATAKPSQGIQLELSTFECENLTFEQRDKWRGKTTALTIGNLQLDANKINFKESIFDIASLVLKKPSYYEKAYKGCWTIADSTAWQKWKDAQPKGGDFPENPGNVKLQIASLSIVNAYLHLQNRLAEPSTQGQFNASDMRLEITSGNIKNLLWNKDTLSVKMNISAVEKNGFTIKKLQADFTFHPKLIELKNMDLVLNESHLTNYYAMAFNTMDDFSDFTSKVKLQANFENATLSTNDISFFAPSLATKNQVALLSANISGYINNLQAKNMQLQVQNTSINGALSISGLPNIAKTYIDFATPGSNFYLKDVAVWADGVNQIKGNLRNSLDPLNFAGSFKGLINDFAINGLINTNQGAITANLTMKIGNGKSEYEGKIFTENLHLGNLMGIADLGKITFGGFIKGSGFSANTAQVLFDGRLQQGFYNNYNYTNVLAHGSLNKMQLTTNLQLGDPNLEGNVDVVLNLNEVNRAYIANGTLTKSNFKALHFTNSNLSFSGNFDVNFKGKNIDDFIGTASLYNAKLLNDSLPLSFDSLIIHSTVNAEGRKELELQTNEMDASVVGKFNIADLPNSIQYFLSNYYPTFINPPKRTPINQDFSFAINAKEIEPYLKIFNPKIEGGNNSSITGIVNTTDNYLLLNANIPYFKYDKFQLSNATLQGTGSATNLDVFGKVDDVVVNDSLSIPNVVLNVGTSNGKTNLKVQTSLGGVLGDAEISTTITPDPDGLRFVFNPSSFIVNNKQWVIEQNGEIILKKNNQIVVNQLKLKQDEQEIALFTLPPSEGDKTELHISTNRLNIADLLPFVLKKPQLEGMATGRFVVVDPLGKPRILIDTLQIEEARLDGDSIGILNIKGTINLQSGLVKATIQSPNIAYNFDADLQLNLYDTSATKEQINTVFHMHKQSIKILNNYLGNLFENIDGNASGNLTISGKFSEPELIGEIQIDSAQLKVAYTQVTYFIDSTVLSMKKGYIGFGKTKLRDRYGNTGSLTGGFNHRFFKDMRFAIKIATDKMELLNTSIKNNQTFFGKAIGRGSFELAGPSNNLNIKIIGEPTDSSHISIANSASKESGEADYITYKKYGIEQTLADGGTSHTTVDVDIKATPIAQIDVILDAVNNDIISATGNGNLHITSNDNGVQMKGRYDIVNGSYDYNFQSFIRKGFKFEGAGVNYIEWPGGDPYNANLNINATYTATKVNFNDLKLNFGTTIPKADVLVIAEIRGKLSNPKIDFKLDLPPNSAIRSDDAATRQIEAININQSEKLKQITYLIVFNQFAPFGGGKGLPTADLAVNTISEIVSRELGKIFSNYLRRITNDNSLQVDFSTSLYNSNDLNSGNISATSYDRTRASFKLGKSIANNRIILNIGSDFDFSVRSSSINAFQFLPDVSVEFVLNNSGKLRFILFKRDNLELGSRRNRAGASLSYRQDFNNFLGKEKPIGTLNIKSKREGVDTILENKNDR